MDLLQAIILGIIQGLTEFLPISSTAHLRIVPALFGWDDPGAAFTAVIQIGTLVAVLIYFARDIQKITGAMLKGIASGKPFQSHDAWLGWMIGLGTIPIVVCGLLFKDAIETTLRSLYVISASMILLALVLMIAEILNKRRIRRGVTLKTSANLKWWEIFVVGIAQAVALIPGSSRSGTTITGGLLMGMSREEAARFSFLLSLPSVFAAGIFEMIKEREELLSSDAGLSNLIVATVVSAIVGYASIAFLLGYLKRHSTYLFIVYRIVVGVLLLGLLGAGVLK
ncbi:undecaprenyl-diphosphatase UppP [bacterium]|nr:undecaprenyl-diphosphatase UppP [bacterium]